MTKYDIGNYYVIKSFKRRTTRYMVIQGLIPMIMQAILYQVEGKGWKIVVKRGMLPTVIGKDRMLPMVFIKDCYIIMIKQGILYQVEG